MRGRIPQNRSWGVGSIMKSVGGMANGVEKDYTMGKVTTIIDTTCEGGRKN